MRIKYCRFIRTRISPILPLCVEHDALANIQFPEGPPRDHHVYIQHPYLPNRYYPAAKFHLRVIEDKASELIRILHSLGATHFRIEHVSGFLKEVDLQAAVGHPVNVMGVTVGEAEGQGEGKYHARQHNSFLWEENSQPIETPCLPADLIWYHHEPRWKEMAEARRNRGAKSLNIEIRCEEDFGINASFAASLSALHTKLFSLNLGGKYVDHQDTL